MVSAKEAMMSTPLYDYSTRSGAMDGYTGMYVGSTQHAHRTGALSGWVHVKCHL